MAEITAATAIGWIVSPVIRKVIGKTLTYISKNSFRKLGINEADMKNMRTTLTEILSVMGAVERQMIVDQNHVKMVQQIKEAVFDAEDVIDEFEYNLLEENFKNQEKMIDNIAASSSRAIYQFVVGNGNFTKKVKEVIESLGRAKVSAYDLLWQMKVNSFSSESDRPKTHETSSRITEEIIGRERECEYLIDLLFEEVDESPTVIPIVGHGGIGKTTLARLIFHDQRVQKHFETIWVCVSENFDKYSLTIKMLKQASENLCKIDGSFEMMQNELTKVLTSKNKILLVLDDVWYDNNCSERYSYVKEWSEVLAPLQNAKSGSKIILTTRFPLVGNVLGSIKPITIDGLNDDDSWSLFKLCAFDHQNQHDLARLEPIGKEIVTKLMGSALAIRVVGAQLRGNSNVEDWKKFLNDNSLDMSYIMKILQKSYEHLPQHLQRCFAFCSLFPKDCPLKPDRLVHMWIAHGFVHPRERKTLDDVGRDYFSDLLTRSFFQAIKCGDKEYYVMHDLMSDLACHVSRGECLMLDKDYSSKNLGSIRHISVTPEAIDIVRNMQDLDKLRTIIFINYASFNEDPIEEVIVKLKRIRVLDIEWKLPTTPNVSECKNLRYLSFRDPVGMLLLKPFSKLHHLRALFVRNKYPKGKQRSYSIPKFSSRMMSLVLVDVSKSFILDVDEVVQLKSLWRGGSISLCVGKKGHKLDLLGDINNARGLVDIRGLEKVTCKEEAIKAQVSNKEHITQLKLWWLGVSPEVKSNEHHEVLEALCPNPRIERLEIYGYQGANCPSWLESNLLSRIKEIHLEACKGLDMLPALGQLPLLRYLFVGTMRVRKIGLEFYGNSTFPSLEELKIYDMWNLEEWLFPSGVQTFPKLHRLIIIYCPKFVCTECNGFPALQEFRICTFDSMFIGAQLKGCGCLLALTKMEITNCKSIIILEGLQDLLFLKRLLINCCPNLLSLPEIKYFDSLEFLAILDCPKLRTLPEKGLPVSLLLLCIGGIHYNLEEQIRNRKGCDWDKLAAISGCKLLTPIGKIYPYSGLELEAERIFRHEYSIKKLGYYNRIWNYKIN